MDLSQKTPKDEDVSTLHILDPETGEPLYDGEVPVTIDLMHSDAPAYRRKQRDLLNRKLKSAALRQGKIEDDPQGEGERAAIETRALAIVRWSPAVGMGNGSFPCTMENAVQLLDTCPFIFEQVARHLNSRANFTKRSQAS